MALASHVQVIFKHDYVIYTWKIACIMLTDEHSCTWDVDSRGKMQRYQKSMQNSYPDTCFTYITRKSTIYLVVQCVTRNSLIF